MPGTLSPRVLTDLLRGELGFTGLVLTDSLEMGALGASGYPPPQAAALALAAGADLLLCNAGLEVHRQVQAYLVHQVRAGAIPLARLDAAVENVLRTKRKFGVLCP